MATLDLLFKALADPTRREILGLLSERARTTGELAEAFPSTRFAVMKHLAVLVRAGLVVPEREGRERWNRLETGPVRELVTRWAGGLIELRHVAEGGPMAKDKAEKTGKAPKAGKVKSKCRAIEVTVELTIDAARERVWSALTGEIGKWWPKDFYVGKSPKGFVLEAHPGGRLYEEWGDGAGVLWGQVVTFDPPATLDVAGQLFPAFGGPATTLVRWALAEEDGRTRVTLTDSVFGRVNEKTAASLDEGWRALTVALKAFVEPAAPAKKPRKPASVAARKPRPAPEGGDGT
jgi:DNA-binding transcriptional ArsR family regulator/uncharacterized protein YndB with AHSA1/START domain